MKDEFKMEADPWKECERLRALLYKCVPILIAGIHFMYGAEDIQDEWAQITHEVKEAVNYEE